MEKSKALTYTRGFYLLYFRAVGCIFPYLNLYYQRIGLSGLQIGILAAIPALVVPFASPLWGIVADSLNLHRTLLSLAVAGTIIPVLLLSASGAMIWLVPVTLVYAFFYGPIGPLIDSTALEVAEASRRSYGELRVWGTIGFIASAWALGRIMESTGLRLLFCGCALFMLGTLALSRFLPPRGQQWRGPRLRGLGVLLADRVLVLFLVSVFLLSATVAAGNNFFTLYLDGLGASEALVGLSWAIAALSEVPVMFLSGVLMRRLAARGLLFVGFAVYALRWFLYSQITSLQMILAVQLLHGLSFGAYYVGGVVYTRERAAEELSATAQALFSGTALGLAGIVGGVLGGYLYDRVGVMNLFRFCGLAATFALVLFLLTPSRRGLESVDSP
ncbi:MAG: MFS transporter [Anaerolineae bacterium]|nr:MFS transporter [Anaerolineae bacterium]NIN95648.1 MFS transporter [Anaerolineae bacterium]NIQ78603.1 MFS transporter [Anaerolineae bacterium]